MSTSHPLVQLARQAIEAYVRQRQRLQPPAELTPEMQERAGAFVSLHKHGGLRGCIGTFEPTQPNELADLEISVDVLSEPEPVQSLAELDPKRYGVIVECGWRRGLLLPDMEGVDTVEYQVDIARRKAGIGRDEPVQLYRFSVRRFH